MYNALSQSLKCYGRNNFILLQWRKVKIKPLIKQDIDDR